jgi:hypothetical protein
MFSPARTRSTLSLMVWVITGAVLAAKAGPVSARPDLIPLQLTEDLRPGDFALVTNGRAADFYVAPEDFKVAQIAADCFGADVARVTGITPKLKSNRMELAGNVVLIGTIGKSAVIDELIRTGRLDVSQVNGQWESFVITTLTNPIPGVSTALVIAGADRRGTAYGVFTLSEAIGVSPWVWWADVTPQKRTAMTRTGGCSRGRRRPLSRRRKTSARKPTRKSVSCCCA